VAATPLSPTGEPPVGAPRLCDASGMAEIHRAFRHAFAEAPALVAGVRTGETAHAAAVASQLTLISGGLHSHHEGEDQRLWSMLEERAPSCAAHVARMKAQHAEMLGHLEALDRAVSAWAVSALPADAEPVQSALAGVSGALAVHLPDEEASIVPVMERTITEREVAWFGEHGRRATPKGRTWDMLGAILAGQPDGDDWLRRNMPLPGRLAWRLIGSPRYTRYRATLVGR
jgi:hypothetical protein